VNAHLAVVGREKHQVRRPGGTTNLHTGTTVWTNIVSETGNVVQRNVPAVVAEMNRTMNRAIEKLLSTLPTPTTKETNVSQGNKEYTK
jgi:hypothetical protein